MFIKPGIRRQSGLTLIELVMFIVIVSIGVVGILSVMNYTTSRSADPLLNTQAISIAEALMEEIQLQAFTYCDPDDPGINPVSPPTSSAGCSSGFNEQSPLGPEAGEQRYASGALTFDNVSDYAGFTMSGIRSIEDSTTVLSGLSGYSAAVGVSNIPASQATALGIGVNDALVITVTVTGPANTSVTLTGYRFRYSPNQT
jgi:MSHA pilin protein MshD